MLPDGHGSTFSSSFSNIDAARDPTEFVRFMAHVRALAQIVGPTGLVVGLDSKTMIEAARRRPAGQRGVELQVGDAQQLNFEDATFDACRTDRVLQHLSDPHQAVHEMARVLRPGGRLVAFEPGTGALLLDAPDNALTRTILNFRGDAVRSAWIGRQLPRLFATTGLRDVETVVLPSPRTDDVHTNASLRLDYYARCAADAGVTSHAEASHWPESLAAWAC